MNRALLVGVILAITCGLPCAPSAAAQPYRSVREAEQYQRAALLSLRQAFRPAVREAAASTVTVRCLARDVALGTVVGEDGYVLTKASEITDPARLTVRLKDLRELDATVVGVVEEHDLAMLKVKARGLKPAVWAKDPELDLGQWVATVAPADLPVSVGVVSVQRRKIPSRNAMLGVALADGQGGVRVMQVVPESGADRAGIQPDDLILGVNGRVAANRADLIEVLEEQHLGSSVRLTIRRGNEKFDLAATLGRRIGNERADKMDAMGGPLSRRNQGFPMVFQHDTVLKPHECGGPVVDADGKVLGINIARAGRTESYAIPADVLPKLIADLRAGKYAAVTRPAANNQQK